MQNDIKSLLFKIYVAGFEHGDNNSSDIGMYEAFNRFIDGDSPLLDGTKYDIKELIDNLTFIKNKKDSIISNRLLNDDEIEDFYYEYNSYCVNLHEIGFYVKHLSKEEFIKDIKTYDDWVFLQIESGYLSDSEQFLMIKKDFEFNFYGDMVKVFTDYGETIQLVKLSEPNKSLGQYDKEDIVEHIKKSFYEI